MRPDPPFTSIQRQNVHKTKLKSNHKSKSENYTHSLFGSASWLCCDFVLIAVKMRKLASGDDVVPLHELLTIFPFFNWFGVLLIERCVFPTSRLWSTEYCFCRRSRRSRVLITVGWHTDSQTNDFCLRKRKLGGRAHDMLVLAAYSVNRIKIGNFVCHWRLTM